MPVAPIIQVTGSISGAALVGIDKDDLVEGEVLTFVDVAPENGSESYEWFIDESPIDASVSLVNPLTSSPTLTVPSDADLESGTIVVRAKISDLLETQIRVSLPMPNTGSRVPHYEEEDAANAGGNTKGWHKSQTKWMRSADRRLPYILTADPSSGGRAAPTGAIGRRDNGNVGELWHKFGVADTAWVLVGSNDVVASKVLSADATTLSVVGLNGDLHGTYEIEGDLIIDTATINIQVEPNGLTADLFSMEAILDVPKVHRAGEWRIFRQGAAVGTYHHIRFKMTLWAARTKNGVARIRSYHIVGEESFDFNATVHNNTYQGSGTLENATSNLVSLDFVSSVVGGIKDGSEIIVRRL